MKMCLDSITDKRLPLKLKYGYKVFRVDIYGKLSFEFYSTGEHIPINKWMKARKMLITNNSDEQYNSGFHCFRNKIDAIRNCDDNQKVFKVQVEGITYKGIQWERYKCIVCKKIKILEEVIC
jgi:hypothetical protein